MTEGGGELRSEYNEKIIKIAQKEPLKEPRSVFISYSSPDQGFVDRLVEDLRKAGVSMWYDKWMIRVGDNIVSKIEEGIRSSRYLLVVLSEDSVNKVWVRKEIEAGLMREFETESIFVIPVVIDDKAVHDMPPAIRAKRYLDFRKDYGAAANELISFLKKE